MIFGSIILVLIMQLILIGSGIKVNKSTIPFAAPGRSVWLVIALAFLPILSHQIIPIIVGMLWMSEAYTLTMFVPSLLLILALIIFRNRTNGVVVFGLSEKSVKQLLNKLKFLECESGAKFDSQQQGMQLKISTYKSIRCAVINGSSLSQTQLLKDLTLTLSKMEGFGKLPVNYFLLVFGLFLLWWIGAAISGLLSF